MNTRGTMQIRIVAAILAVIADSTALAQTNEPANEWKHASSNVPGQQSTPRINESTNSKCESTQHPNHENNCS